MSQGPYPPPPPGSYPPPPPPPGAPPPPGQAPGGLTPNVAAALSYLWIVAIVFLVLEPYNRDRFVRFHAFQSLFILAAEIIVGVVLAVSIIGWILLPFTQLAFLAARIIGGLKAYQNEWFKLPVLGDMAEKQAG